jgi:hypothetical protein
MTDDEINAELALLGFDRRWVDLGVLTEEFLPPDGSWREMISKPLRLLGQALFGYLHERKAIDDATLAKLLDIAARTHEDLSRALAAWQHCTTAQLAQIVRHNSAAPGVRRLAAQRLRFRAREGGADVAVKLDGFGERIARDASDGDATAWEQPLAADPRRRVGALLGALPDAEQMKCHDPVFGLRLDPGTSDETRMSICFMCNNIFLDGGGRRTPDGDPP